MNPTDIKCTCGDFLWKVTDQLYKCIICGKVINLEEKFECSLCGCTTCIPKMLIDESIKGDTNRIHVCKCKQCQTYIKVV